MTGTTAKLRPVTVGLPFSNQDVAQFELAIRSVFAQDYAAWHLILVADGPSDNVERARLIDDPRVTLIRGERSEGLAARLNQIARATSTDLLFRMDADDVMRPDRLRIAVGFFDSHPSIDLVGSRTVLIDEHDVPRGLFRESASLPSMRSGYLRSNVFSHPTVVGRAEWFRNNPYDETLMRSQDKALWLTSSGHSQFAKLEEPLLFYRVDSRLAASRQALSSRYDRVLLRRYGPLIDGRETRALIVKSHIKQRVFGLGVRFGASERLYRRKYETLPPAELDAARRVIEAIAATPVPGW